MLIHKYQNIKQKNNILSSILHMYTGMCSLTRDQWPLIEWQEWEPKNLAGSMVATVRWPFPYPKHRGNAL